MQDEDAVQRLVARHSVAMWTPEIELDDAVDATKIGGTPWLDDEWPDCPACTKPLRFILQLHRDQVPEPCRWAFRTDLLQLFLCDEPGKTDDSDWLCQSARGWEPYAPSTLVRHVHMTGLARSLPDALTVAQRERLVRFRHAWLSAYCARTDGASLPELSVAELSRRAESLGRIPGDVDVDVFVLPPQRIVRWRAQRDVPAYGDLDLDDLDQLAEAGHRCARGHKLGGAPAWAQDPRVPGCRACHAPMRYLFQLTTSGPIAIGGDGIGWLFVCPTCLDGTFTWQR